MTPLDKEVAEWMEGLGFRFGTLGSDTWFHNSDDGVVSMPVSPKVATFFYTATKQAELKARIDELEHLKYPTHVAWMVKKNDKRFNPIAVSERLDLLEAQLNQTKLEKGYKDEQ